MPHDLAPAETPLPTRFELRTRGDDGAWTTLATVFEREGQASFILADLPCGECGPCRRALVSSCVNPQRWTAMENQPPPARYSFGFDTARLPLATAAWAAAVAPLLEAIGRAGLGPGDVSFWLGSSPYAVLGACLAAVRGSKAYLCGHPVLEAALADVVAEDREQGPRFVALGALNEAALDVSRGSPSGFAERHVFVLDADALVWSAATNLLVPGTTLVSLGAAPALAGLPEDARLFTMGTRCNPDFAPEALAALATNALVARACDLLRAAALFEIAAIP